MKQKYGLDLKTFLQVRMNEISKARALNNCSKTQDVLIRTMVINRDLYIRIFNEKFQEKYYDENGLEFSADYDTARRRGRAKEIS